MKTIIIKFSGPLQSWGSSSNFENRDTARHPTKSAVMGLVAGALGYQRDENEKIQELNDLHFGVRIEQQGILLRDYHIAKSKKDSYVTSRYYLQDAVFLAMISHENSIWIDNIVKALTYPVFSLFMGRRCSPVGNDYFLGVEERDLLTTIKTYPWQASEWYQKKFLRKDSVDTVVLDAFVDAYLLDNMNPPILQRDRIESFSSKNRSHGFRPVKTFQVELEIEGFVKDTEHDVFQSIGGV